MTKCLIVMALGPDFPAEFVQDTLDSFAHYMPPEQTMIWLMDDTEAQPEFRAGSIPVRHVKRTEVYPFSKPEDLWNAPLGLKLLRTMILARKEFDYSLVLRIDTDALITGHSPHLEAAKAFADDPTISIIGALTKRGDGTDKRDAMREAGRSISREMQYSRMLKDAFRRGVPMKRTLHLRSLYKKAAENPSYSLGDTCTGGAVFISRKAVDRFAELGIDRMDALRFSRCSEDWMFGLFSAAAGFRLSDDPTGTMAVNWRGLPCPPSEVPERNIKVFHPVKLETYSEQEAIRKEFRAQRLNSPVSCGRLLR